MSPEMKAFFARLDQHTDEMPLDVLRRELEQLHITVDDLAGHVQFGDEHYQRHRMHVGPTYHALALCWGPGQHSVIHNHQGSGCGFLVVQGTATETRYDRNDDGRLVRRDTRTHRPGSVSVSVDADIHRMGNSQRDDQPGLVTMHIYTPPLLQAVTYEEGSTETGLWVDDDAEQFLTASRSRS